MRIYAYFGIAMALASQAALADAPKLQQAALESGVVKTGTCRLKYTARQLNIMAYAYEFLGADMRTMSVGMCEWAKYEKEHNLGDVLVDAGHSQ